jgi:cytochrome c-type biogenesis protein CcmH
VQLRPPLRGDTLALWFGPLAALLLGGLGAFAYIRSRAPDRAAMLTADEEAQAAALLQRDEAG